ncbi:MAG: hypothetical protein HYZ26_06430 [Chloroflexi bacterium]|nr:hypothetical protein [Chloroflexota bacterium]
MKLLLTYLLAIVGISLGMRGYYYREHLKLSIVSLFVTGFLLTFMLYQPSDIPEKASAMGLFFFAVFMGLLLVGSGLATYALTKWKLNKRARLRSLFDIFKGKR